MPEDPLVPCEKHELPNCSACKPPPPKPPGNPARGGFRRGAEARLITAEYESDCINCGTGIQIGDRIYYDVSGWSHADC